MEYYISTINEFLLIDAEEEAFSIPVTVLSEDIDNWEDILSFDSDITS